MNEQYETLVDELEREQLRRQSTVRLAEAITGCLNTAVCLLDDVDHVDPTFLAGCRHLIAEWRGMHP